MKRKTALVICGCVASAWIIATIVKSGPEGDAHVAVSAPAHASTEAERLLSGGAHFVIYKVDCGDRPLPLDVSRAMNYTIEGAGYEASIEEAGRIRAGMKGVDPSKICDGIDEIYLPSLRKWLETNRVPAKQ